MKFELQHFLLAWRERAQNSKEEAARLFCLEVLVRRRLLALARFEQLLVEIRHAFFLTANIEGAIAANGEEPFRRGVVEFGPIFELEFHKSFLHDITCAVAIAQNARRILQERPLEALEERVHLFAVDSRRLDLNALHLFSLSLTREMAENYRIFLTGLGLLGGTCFGTSSKWDISSVPNSRKVGCAEARPSELDLLPSVLSASSAVRNSWSEITNPTFSVANLDNSFRLPVQWN